MRTRWIATPLMTAGVVMVAAWAASAHGLTGKVEATPPASPTAAEHFRRAARAGHQASRERLQQLGETW